MPADGPQPASRLPRGPRALDPDERRRIHRERLQSALIALVGEHGYAGTTIRDLSSRAQVAARDLYAQYPGKQELLLATCDAAVQEVCDAVTVALEDAPPSQEIASTVQSVLEPIARAIAARPDHARLVLVDVFAAGSPGAAYRRELVARLHRRLATALATPDRADGLSEPSLTIVAAGVLHVFEQRVRDGRTRTLPRVVPELAAWAAGYRTTAPLPLPVRRSPADPPPPSQGLPGLPQDARNLPREFVVPHQRERIVRAVIDLSAEHGYDAVAVPAIATRARTSNRTFYQHFAGKEEAFAAVYDQAFGLLFARTWAAASTANDWPTAVRDGVRAWTSTVVADPPLARFALVDALGAGRDAIDRQGNALRAFADLLARGRPDDRGPSATVSLAIVGGIAGLVAAWIAEGRTRDLPQLVPHLSYAILAPSLGDHEALRAAGLLPAPQVIIPPEPTDDAGRAAVAFTQLVAERGWGQATLAEAAERIGVAPAAIAEHFHDETDCALQTLDAWSDRTFTAMAAAFASSQADASLAVHHALGAMLAQMASEPDLLILAIEAVDHLGSDALSRRARYAAVFFDVLIPSLPIDAPIPAVPAPVLEMIAEGVFAVLRRHVADGRIEELPSALPEISFVCLAPFFGRQRALDASRMPVAVVG